MGRTEGQASVEWVGLLLLVAALLTITTLLGGRWLSEKIGCLILGSGCEQNQLVEAYGEEVGKLVRRYAPNLSYEAEKAVTMPVDFRSCQRRLCADSKTKAGAIEQTRTGLKPMIFTHVIDRRDRNGDLYMQYWFYYPDSTWKPSLKDITGYHLHDWEGYQVKLDKKGHAQVRATSHHGYTGENDTQDQFNQLPFEVPGVGKDHAWTKDTYWTYVTEGSHAGHIVRKPKRNHPQTPARSIRLMPIEQLEESEKGTDFGEIQPPWRKPSYRDPELKDA